LKILHALHSLAIGGHSGIAATYQRLKRIFHWHNLKKEVELFVSECPVCQRAKGEHCKYPGILQPLPILDMAWSHISLDFVEGLPKSHEKDVIMVVVDRLTKYSHFIALSHPYNAQLIVHLFIDNIVKLHGFPNVIVSDRDAIFTSDLWKTLFNAMKVQLNFSSAHHPQTDG
jgi:hypothetical protein